LAAAGIQSGLRYSSTSKLSKKVAK